MRTHTCSTSAREEGRSADKQLKKSFYVPLPFVSSFNCCQLTKQAACCSLPEARGVLTSCTWPKSLCQQEIGLQPQDHVATTTVNTN